jgi:hypothetical protein
VRMRLALVPFEEGADAGEGTRRVGNHDADALTYVGPERAVTSRQRRVTRGRESSGRWGGGRAGDDRGGVGLWPTDPVRLAELLRSAYLNVLVGRLRSRAMGPPPSGGDLR